METQFTPLISALGGGLIGLSAVLLMGLSGRIAGISGITAGILTPSKDSTSDLGWRLWFVAGLLIAPLATPFLTGQAVEQTVSSNIVLMIIAGLLTGYGSVYGGGCTSGHGVCGISRLSLRSIIATCTFMATAIVTVFIVRHVIGGL